MLAALVPACLLFTVALEAAKPRPAVLESDDLREGQLEAAAAVVLLLIGGVLLGRLRRERASLDLLFATALLVMAITSLFASVATPIADSLSESVFTTWTTALAVTFGAVLLTAAALCPERSVGRGSLPLLWALGGSAVVLLVIVIACVMLEDRLPAAFERTPRTAAEIRSATEHPALLAMQLVTAAGWGAAAMRAAALADREQDELWRHLAFGAALAAVAYLNYALVPSQYTELLYTGDLFFLLAIGALLFGAIVETTSTEAALVRWAVSSERTRVADELRAGVAQELAYMASQTELLARRPAGRHPFEELAASVERALDESRGAISALVRPVDEPLAAALADAAREAAAGVGARVRLDLADGVDVDREWRDALIRLTRDSVTTAARHRGARAFTVQLRGGRHVTLRIVDDGAGIDPAGPRSAATVALQALRERAESRGARFSAAPADGSGTAVEVVVP